MSVESLNLNPEKNPLDILNQKQDDLARRIHSFATGNSGDTYFGTMGIYREPEVIKLTLGGQGDLTIFKQDRCNSDDLGVRTRLTLTHQRTTGQGQTTTTYRFNPEKAVKRYINGDGITDTAMTIEDFRKAKKLLDAINGMITASLKKHIPQSQAK